MLVVLSAMTLVAALARAPAISELPQVAVDAQKPRPTPDPLYDGTVKNHTPGLTNPVALKYGKGPLYTPEAKRLKIEGTVIVLTRVETDGTVAYAEILRSLDAVHGLDAEALKEAKQWVFRPARLNGRPVPVVITLELDFHLH